MAKAKLTNEEATKLGLLLIENILDDKSIQELELLIEKGANLDVLNLNGLTSLMYASRDNRFEVVELLLRNKADINIKGRNDATALHIACQYGLSNMAKYLIEKKAIVSSSCMDWACFHVTNTFFVTEEIDMTEVIKLLIENGINVNNQDKIGWTPLFYASVKGDIKLFNTLIELKADPNIRDKNNHTSLFFALDNKHIDLAKSLLKHGAKWNNNWGDIQNISNIGGEKILETNDNISDLGIKLSGEENILDSIN